MRRIISAGSVDGGGKSFTVRDLLHHALRVDVRFNSNFEGLRQALRVAEAIATRPGVGDSGPVELDEGDWDAVCTALRSPSPLNGMTPYPLSPGHACMPLVQLVLDAKKETP